MRKILYLGTERKEGTPKDQVIHYPVIQLIPRAVEEIKPYLESMDAFTHVLITSKNAVKILFDFAEQLHIDLASKLVGKTLSIGPQTSLALKDYGTEPLWEAKDFSQEGMIEEIKQRNWEKARILYPRSSLARNILKSYLNCMNISCVAFDLYDTVNEIKEPVPCLDQIDEIIFTSPSTVKGFFQAFGVYPKKQKLTFQGKVSEQAFYEIASKYFL